MGKAVGRRSLAAVLLSNPDRQLQKDFPRSIKPELRRVGDRCGSPYYSVVNYHTTIMNYHITALEEETLQNLHFATDQNSGACSGFSLFFFF